MIKAIETQYKGYRFRSRLEARWAVFFDALGIEWEYELEGYELFSLKEWYLPDFFLQYKDKERDSFLHGRTGYFLEVKGEYLKADLTKLYLLCQENGNHGILVVGINNPKIFFCVSGGEIYAPSLAGTFGLVTPGMRDEDSYLQALQKAKSARFEHGESG